MLIQIVQHHLGHFAALEFNDQPHARLVAFVLNVADAFDFFLMHQFGHALLQRLFVDLIRQLINDDGLALAFVDILKMALGTHYNPAASRPVTVPNAVDAVNDAAGRKVWRRHKLNQLINRGLRILQQVKTRVHDFIEIMRWNVGRHAHGNTARAVDQQIRKACRHNQRLVLAAIVVGAKVDRFLVQIGQQFVRNLGEPDFRVSHGRSTVAID